MAELVKRIITGITGAAVFIGGLLYSEWSMWLLFFAITIFVVGEFYRIVQKMDGKSFKKIDLVTYVLYAAALYASGLFALFYGQWYGFIPLALILWFVIQNRMQAENSSADTNSLLQQLFGFVYTVWPLLVLNILAYYNYNNVFNPFNVLGIVAIMWGNDIMAFFIGKQFGKTPLAKKISPNKTIEGFIGGFIGAMIVAAACMMLIPNGYGLHWFGIAAVVSIAGPLGDLFESALKRKADIKDSGSLLPGHGGFLDRFDALLVAVPFVFVYLLLFL